MRWRGPACERGKTHRRRRRAGRSGADDAQGDACARRSRGDRLFRQGRTRQPFARYREAIRDFFDAAAATIAVHLEAGRTVAVICEGDPLFYGSYMHLHTRLAPRFRVEIVAGVTGMSGCWSAAGTPIAQGNDIFTVLPATLPEDELTRRFSETNAAVVMKVGRHLPKVRRALKASGRLPRAIYVERGTMSDAK